MAGEASRWVSYDEAADLLGLPAEAVKRLALRRSWPRRPGPAGATLVAVPEAIPGEPSDDPDEVEVGRGGARSLLDYLEAHVERLTEELTETRTEMRGVRYEAESLRIEAGRVPVFAALVEAERARSAEISAERDRLADELARCRRSWIGRMLGPLLDRRPARTSPSSRDPT